MNYSEQAFTFKCCDCRLLGIATQPDIPADTGVLILVGGPQYRAGSHRQFTLLARQLAAQGIASMRFDYRGMGDSEGEARTFEQVDDDILAATNTFIEHVPAVQRVVIWGLCDAASSALFYAHTDTRIGGLILLNPWVHTEAGAARSRLRYYYLDRLMQRSFWTKLLSGKIQLGQSVGDLTKSAQSVADATNPETATPTDPRHGSPGYIDRMLDGLKNYRGDVFILLSGNDLVAQEFMTLLRHDKCWREVSRASNISRSILKDANHTFSSQTWRDEAANRTAQWLLRKIIAKKS